MAITSAIMQMRRGEEAYFDPDKMHPGEWAVSTDTKYVRMCFSPGVCVRMATYEAFEEDMEQIISILEEAKTVQEAIEKIYEEFQKAELDIEAAENYATLSESYAIGGTGTREGEDTDNAKYYAEKAKENIEPAMNAVSDIALNRQTLGYTKKNLLKLKDVNHSDSEISITSNATEGTATMNSVVAATSMKWKTVSDTFYLKTGTYIFTGCPAGGRDNGYRQTLGVTYADDGTYYGDINDYGEGATFTVTQEMADRGIIVGCTIFAFEGCHAKNLTFYPMLRSAEIEDGTFEPYVDDVDTRLKALTPVNNLLATVPGSPLDAVMGKELNDMIVALEERLKWKRLTIPEPILDTEGYIRTYEIDLSSYTEVEINLFIANYGQFSTYRCCLSGGGDYGYIYFLDEYTDQNGYSFGARLRVYRNKIEVYTLPRSTNPTLNYITVHGIMAR